MIPYWSRSTVAFHQKDYAWLIKSIKNTFALFLFFIIGYFILFFSFDFLVKIWLKRDFPFEKGLIITMCVFYILHSLMSLTTSFINGSGLINTQLVVYLIIGLANIPLSIFMGYYLGMGVTGIRLATTILILFANVAFCFNLFYILHSLKKQIS